MPPIPPQQPVPPVPRVPPKQTPTPPQFNPDPFGNATRGATPAKPPPPRPTAAKPQIPNDPSPAPGGSSGPKQGTDTSGMSNHEMAQFLKDSENDLQNISKFVSDMTAGMGKQIKALNAYAECSVAISHTMQLFSFNISSPKMDQDTIDLTQSAASVSGLGKVIHCNLEPKLKSELTEILNKYAAVERKIAMHQDHRRTVKEFVKKADDAQEKLTKLQGKNKVDLVKMSEVQHDRDSWNERCRKCAVETIEEWDQLKQSFFTCAMEEFNQYIRTHSRFYHDAVDAVDPLIQKAESWHQRAASVKSAQDESYIRQAQAMDSQKIVMKSPALQNFVTEEKNLVQTLEKILDNFLDNVMKDGSLFAEMGRDDVSVIFSGVRALYHLHSEILKNITASQSVVSTFNEQFVVHFVHTYERYCQSFLASQAKMYQCRTDSKAFSHLMKDVDSKIGRARGVDDFFADPLRRIEQYVQFFQDADQLHLSAADYDYCSRLAETMRELNEQASQALGINTVSKIMRNITNWPEGDNQYAAERRFVVRYLATSPQGQGEILLFNDIVLFAKKPIISIPGLNKGSLQYVHAFPVAGIAVRNVADDPSRRIAATIELADSSSNVSLQLSFDCDGTKGAVMSRIQDLQSQACVNMLFGVKLETLMQSKSQQTHGIPSIIDETCAVLEAKWLTLEGLFRISASKAELTEMRNRLDNGIPVNYNQFNGHSVAGILKFWLRSMPEPLIPFSMYHDFLNALAGRSPEDGVKNLTGLVRRLPALNRQCLHRIMCMLKQVMDHSSENMMNAGNISIVFSPLLLRDRGRDALPDLSSNTFDCVAAMVTNYDVVFGQYVPGSAGPRAPAPKKKINIGPVTREESARLNEEFMVFDENGASASVGPASSEAALSLRDIVKQGALLKNREKKQAVWDQRWVVVKKGWLYDFRNQRDTNCSIVPLQTAIVCEHTDPLGKQRFCFVVKPSNPAGMSDAQPTEYVFAAKSADEMSQWISAISVCVI